MGWATVHKNPLQARVRPNLLDYDETSRTFSWVAARSELDGLPGGGINMAFEAVDRHVRHGRGDRVAMCFVPRVGPVTRLTYEQLRGDTNRFANGLQHLGVRAGDRVFLLLNRQPALPTAMLGALKTRAVVSPLFSAFGPEPVRQRVSLGDGRVVVTTASLYRKKILPVRAELPALHHVVIVDDEGEALPDDTVRYSDLMAHMSAEFTIPDTSPEDMALLHFTSGTTGTPKGAVHVHGAVIAHHTTGRLALDLHDDDVFWCTADPGWVTGTSYGIISPLTNGVTVVVDEGDFDAERWYGILEEHGVSVWYVAPTAVRMLMRAGEEAVAGKDLSRLRFVASVGEPLNPEAVVWGDTVLGRPIHDNWWQTETGGIMIANYAAMDIRPGSMGRPVPGVEATVLARDDTGGVRLDDGGQAVVAPVGSEGHLALRRGWPSMFRGYLHEEERYRSCFVGEWYVTGDLARRDADGYFWFVGRADDVIKSSGHLIGPFEVESTLMEHAAVAEAGVIGTPDEVAGEVVKAFVSLRPGWEASEDLRLELIGFARKKLGPAVAPRQIEFDQHLPKTKSGKILRRLLKARELGLPEGDLSTLEQGS